MTFEVSIGSMGTRKNEMKKKPSASSARAKRTAKNVRSISDDEIDYSDIPPLTDEQLKNARRLFDPSHGDAKQLVALRLSPKLIDRIRKMADLQKKPYQVFIHELLENATKSNF